LGPGTPLTDIPTFSSEGWKRGDILPISLLLMRRQLLSARGHHGVCWGCEGSSGSVVFEQLVSSSGKLGEGGGYSLLRELLRKQLALHFKVCVRSGLVELLDNGTGGLVRAWIEGLVQA